MNSGDGRFLIVGAGLIGGAVFRRLSRVGRSVAGLATRPGPCTTVCADLATEDGRRTLACLAGADGVAAVVLCHGPSDVTACEDAPRATREIHEQAAAGVIGHGVPVLLVSTDNVFPGMPVRHRAGDPRRPVNAYGRAKAAAEDVVLADPGGSVLRVSLVYGPGGRSGHRPDYVRRCMARLRAGEYVDAPVDQTCTPVHVDDVTTVIAALLLAPPPLRYRLRHLAGSQMVSRVELAMLAARAVGASAGLVRPVAREGSALACRPRYSALASGPFDDVPALAGFQAGLLEDHFGDLARWTSRQRTHPAGGDFAE